MNAKKLTAGQELATLLRAVTQQLHVDAASRAARGDDDANESAWEGLYNEAAALQNRLLHGGTR